MNGVLKLFLFFSFEQNVYSKTSENLYEKIDLFGEVLEKIKRVCG